MLHRTKVLLSIALALTLVVTYWGCSRMTGKDSENQAPVVYFVNVPLDSTTFSYAPVVRWSGYDPDGMVTEFQYYDDSTQAAVQAYEAGSDASRHYISLLSESLWTNTQTTQDTIYLRRSEQDSITQHVFIIRAMDDRGGLSDPRVRTFFRTNKPPWAPLVKWSQDAAMDTLLELRNDYTVRDTLFWDDSLTLTYPGIGFLWTGSDPDGNDLNPIKLTYSWALVRENGGAGDTVPHEVYDDSMNVIGHAGGFSQWRDWTQMTFYANYIRKADPSFELDGTYTFILKVRDDGLTEANQDSMGKVHFTAIRPLMSDPDPSVHKQLLIVDWNFAENNPSYRSRYGLRPDSSIMNFYQQVIPEGLQLAQQARTHFNSQFPGYLPYPDEIGTDVTWFSDKNLNNSRRVPYDYIRHFKWVWIICDNPPWQTPSEVWSMHYRLKVLSDYQNVGGQVMISGRRMLQGVFNVPASLPTGMIEHTANFLRTNCNLGAISPASPYGAENQLADFKGTTTTDGNLVPLTLDTTMLRNSMQFNFETLDFMPEVDFFGRSSSYLGYDAAFSPFNYNSTSAGQPYEAHNIRCDVISSTPSQVFLAPYPGHSRILNATRVINLAKTHQYGDTIFGQFMFVDLNGPAGSKWRIAVSTPSQYGAWATDDTILVDYSYIPISPAHDQPVAVDFQHQQGVYGYNPRTGQISYDVQVLYRTAFWTIPLSSMKNDVVDVPYLTGVQASRVAIAIAYQTLFFNGPRHYGQGDIGGGNTPGKRPF